MAKGQLLVVFLYRGQKNFSLALTCPYARKELTNNWAVLYYANGLILIFGVYVLAEPLLIELVVFMLSCSLSGLI